MLGVEVAGNREDIRDLIAGQKLVVKSALRLRAVALGALRRVFRLDAAHDQHCLAVRLHGFQGVERDRVVNVRRVELVDGEHFRLAALAHRAKRRIGDHGVHLARVVGERAFGRRIRGRGFEALRLEAFGARAIKFVDARSARVGLHQQHAVAGRRFQDISVVADVGEATGDIGERRRGRIGLFGDAGTRARRKVRLVVVEPHHFGEGLFRRLAARPALVDDVASVLHDGALDQFVHGLVGRLVLAEL